MNKKAIIIVGLGFGDEGKGLVTDYFCGKVAHPLVVRFNGGHQAGHTVVTSEGKRHMFSCFGSGSFRGISTYWSNRCTFSPSITLLEYEELKELGIQPRLLLDELCPVTTHYDVLYNRALEATRGEGRHGSCGLGFGATVERSQFPRLKLSAQDLLYPEQLTNQLHLIRAYYEAKINQHTRFTFNQFDHDFADQEFIDKARKICKLIDQNTISIVNESAIFSIDSEWETYVFEGAQGILLDMDSDFKPYVTPSHTTSKNAVELLITNLPGLVETEIAYVTRCYLTRHGAGPLLSPKAPNLTNQQFETNQYNEYQREFRIGYLNIDLLNYALSCDSSFSPTFKKHLIVTCLDQLESDQVPCYKDGIEIWVDYNSLPKLLDYQFESHRSSFGNCSDDII